MRHLFNSKIDFQESTVVKDDYGSETITWTDISGLISVGARINWFSGVARGETFVNGRIEWARDAKIYTGYSSGISIDDRLVYNSKNYDIINIEDFDEMNKYMTLTVKRSS